MNASRMQRESESERGSSREREKGIRQGQVQLDKTFICVDVFDIHLEGWLIASFTI